MRKLPIHSGRTTSIAIFLVLLATPLPAQRVDERMTQGYTDFLGALFGLNLSAAERDQIRKQVEGYRATGDRESMETVRQSAETWARLQQQPPELAAAALRMTRPDILLAVEKAARNGRADSLYLLDLYYRANPILAPAKPGGLPLTRDMIEADLALKHWLASEIHRQKVPAPDARVIEAAVQAAVKAHSSLAAGQQLQLARQPGEWARVRYGWSRASEIDKLLTRAEMGARLTPPEQAAVQQILAGFHAQWNGMVARHRNSMLSSAIQNMKDNTDTIMGRGTVWNPATNRWEQQGGIVTEYNGTVRVP